MTSIAQTDRNLISTAIEKLRSYTQVDVQADWRCAQTELDALTGELVQLNAKGHVAWSAGQILWLAQKFVVPDLVSGYPVTGMSLRLSLTWWAEIAEIYVDGQLVQAGDLFDCSARVLLSASVTPKTEFTVIIKLVSPSHDAGALVRSRLVYESTEREFPEPGFIADEFAVLHEYLNLEPKNIPLLADAIAQIDLSALPDKQQFMRSLLQVRNSVQHLASNIKQRQIQLVGHAHLDLAWLWEISETWDAAQRTFTSVLNLQQDFPELTFCHSTPALYAWIEEHRPDLFAAIQQQVMSGRWEVIGGLWVEPELNLISGESIVRQLLYGQRYVLEKFGKISTVAWLPDSFGFCATLPQFLTQAGIEYFVTQKLLWNDTTQFPYKTFWWQSPDGTAILSLMSAPIGESIDPTKMAAYACNWEQQTNLKTSLWLPGVGDHGGGPTRDMLEIAQRWQSSPFFPQLQFTTTENYLQEICSSHPSPLTHRRQDACATQAPHPPQARCLYKPLPIWHDELYLEFHRGCYTTHADQKRWNRRCEGLLYQAELFATLATLTTATAYPKVELETAWKKVLFNQFHDILPGSSIPEVYTEVNPTWENVQQVGTTILQQSLAAIASQIYVPSPPHPQAQPFVVFNSLNWQRSEVIAIALLDERQYTIYDLEANLLPTQQNASTLLFQATDVPGVGYRVFWLCPQNGNSNANFTKSIPASHYYSDNQKNILPDWILENEFLRVVLDAQTGDLSNVFDKICGCEILDSAGGNQLQAFRDRGQYWDAWNIDPNYAEYPLQPTQLKSIEWVEQGEIESRLRVVRQLGTSEFQQDYILQIGSPLLKIVTTVDWQEEHVIVKAAFPFDLESTKATYEIACGAIERPTKPETPDEKAKWEVPALQWADLSTSDRGVSLLNDCKYGYDSQPHQIRLTLLRGAKWPDPDADRGWHQFTYAIYPHKGTWQQAQTVRRGYELNLPLQVAFMSTQAQTHLPAIGCFVNLSAENLILMAFKPSEDNPQQLILRCYECHGEPAQLCLQSDLGVYISHPVDLLERETIPQNHVQPWKIVSYAVKVS